MSGDAKAGCSKDCVTYKCSCCWPDGSCGALPKGRRYPPFTHLPNGNPETDPSVYANLIVIDDGEALVRVAQVHPNEGDIILLYAPHCDHAERMMISKHLTDRVPVKFGLLVTDHGDTAITRITAPVDGDTIIVSVQGIWEPEVSFLRRYFESIYNNRVNVLFTSSGVHVKHTDKDGNEK